MRWMKKEKQHESVSLTLLIVLTLVITAKLCISGLTIYGHHFGEFTSGDWTTIFTPVAGLYFGRKFGKRDSVKKPESSDTPDNPSNEVKGPGC